ncbi:MAG: hypothetical protein ABEJ58_09930 [Halodesulfurarchaeum sp.]
MYDAPPLAGGTGRVPDPTTADDREGNPDTTEREAGNASIW